jgi:hypothetical protein
VGQLSFAGIEFLVEVPLILALELDESADKAPAIVDKRPVELYPVVTAKEMQDVSHERYTLVWVTNEGSTVLFDSPVGPIDS